MGKRFNISFIFLLGLFFISCNNIESNDQKDVKVNDGGTGNEIKLSETSFYQLVDKKNYFQKIKVQSICDSLSYYGELILKGTISCGKEIEKEKLDSKLSPAIEIFQDEDSSLLFSEKYGIYCIQIEKVENFIYVKPSEFYLLIFLYNTQTKEVYSGIFLPEEKISILFLAPEFANGIPDVPELINPIVHINHVSKEILLVDYYNGYIVDDLTYINYSNSSIKKFQGRPNRKVDDSMVIKPDINLSYYYQEILKLKDLSLRSSSAEDPLINKILSIID